jgi:acetyltransferase-like isoleucine patch superfamily enzyme
MFRKEIREFIRSDEMVLNLPRDYSTDMISQWISVRNVLRPPINWLLVGFSKFIPHSRLISSFYRTFLGMKIGSKVGFAQINPDFIIPELIEIGDNSAFGWKVTILTHEFGQTQQRFGKVRIGKNVLVGGYSIIRSGITIGDNSVISPNSVVVCDIPPNEIWGGNPARKLRDNDL